MPSYDQGRVGSHIQPDRSKPTPPNGENTPIPLLEPHRTIPRHCPDQKKDAFHHGLGNLPPSRHNYRVEPLTPAPQVAAADESWHQQ
ncbi:hypothetical protein D3C72_1553040 [compost metagenome]